MFAPNWIAASAGAISLKTPTCLLLTPDGKFDKFGYEAEDKYADLALENQHTDYYFFRRFKMKLHRNPSLNRETQIEEEGGKTLPARTVFAHGINFLKDHALDKLRLQGTQCEDWEVRWVLTVPAIWSEAAKQFMREAAQKADLTNDQLTIALEPEAASVYCRTVPNAMGDNTFEPGSKYMVVDLGAQNRYFRKSETEGIQNQDKTETKANKQNTYNTVTLCSIGGTADITVHEVQENGALRELHKASGGAWGGTRVDSALEQLFIDIVEEDVWSKFKKRHGGDYFELFRDFEVKKRTVKMDDDKKLTNMKLPLSLKDLYEEMKPGEKFKDAVEDNEMYSGRLKLLGDKMRVDQQLMKGLFRDPIDKLTDHMRQILTLPCLRKKPSILLVGGFSESPIVQETIRENFPTCTVIVPNEAGLSVLKGAVLFGHRPKTIASRVLKYTYGIAVSKPFIEGHHPPEKRCESTYGAICRDVFHKYVEAGESVGLDESQSVSFTMAQGACMSRVRVYTSADRDPMFVTDEGCTLLGEVTISLDNPSMSTNKVNVGLTFGGTEVSLQANTSGRTFGANFDFLS
ncbi:hypothetical protein FSP39_000673 [Pinctada imbricata]|uniref:Heat shock 70 kDa protein 12A n=1 Tax=Pinctada imbricata TaxID=66713 RepID=A0AA89BWL7_PINIB|nr:hypothetical protein FSP39_000673 [Pinctada imbricata]